MHNYNVITISGGIIFVRAFSEADAIECAKKMSPNAVIVRVELRS